jgi:hypothetical protein
MGAEFTRDLLHKSQLAQRRPGRVAALPAGARRQPDGKGLGKILGRMALRIPVAQVLHMVAARRPRAIGGAIGFGCRPEQRTPVGPAPQTVGGIDRMSGFVSQDTHQPVDVAALDLVRHLALQAHQPRVGEIKRHGDAWHPVG